MSEITSDEVKQENKLKREQINKELERIIPGIFITNIENTDINTHHKEEIKAIACLLKMMIWSHPAGYVSKSKIREEYSSPFCKVPIVAGTVENALRIFEKQYFDVIGLLYCGAYRSIMAALRQILEQSVYIVNSITNMEDLTGEKDDRNKAMSYAQFKKFLYCNEKSHKKSRKNTKNKKILLSYKKCLRNIKEYVNHVDYADKQGTEALGHIFGILSGWAHANIWQEINDRDDNIHNPEQTHAYVTNLNKEEYHYALNMIIKVYEIIFYLLLVATYENIGYYNNMLAKEFFNEMKYEIQQYSAIKFTAIKKLLEDPPNTSNNELYDGIKVNCSECNKIIINDCKCSSCDEIQMITCTKCEQLYELGTECNICDELDNRI